MSDLLLIIPVLVVAIGGLIGVAYVLDKRGQKNRAGPALPEPGPSGRILLWLARILVVIMVLSIIGAIAFRSLPLVGLTISCLFFYILIGLIYRVVRLTGK